LGANREEKKLAISVIFCHQLDLIDKLNLWGDGAVKVGKGNCFEEPRQFTDPSGEHELNTESLFDISGAEEAIMAYFDFNSLSGELNQVGRSEKDVSLRMTPVLLAEVEQSRKDELNRRTSHNRDLLGSLTTKAYLTSRLTELREEFPFLCTEVTEVQIPNSSEKKDKFVEAVAKAHENIIAKVPDFVRQVKEAMSAQYLLCNGFADRQRKRRELARPFYSLPQTAKAEFFDRKYSILYIEDVEERREQDGDMQGDDEQPARTPERAPATEEETSDTPFLIRECDQMSLFTP
jgi:hypothetical protein